MALLLTLVTGLFFVIGFIIDDLCNNKEKLSAFSIALAFVVLLNLIIFDIIPDVLDNFSFYSIIFIILGILILKILDLFIPDHDHHHSEKNDDIKEHTNHINHISLVTVLALIIHNILECIALYNITTGNLLSGLMMCLAIALHNIPLGFQISSGIKKHRAINLILVSVSGFIGGILALVIKDISPLITSFLLCFTLGMLLYLLIFEFTKELWESRKNIYAIYGLVFGLIIIIISILL